MQVRETRAQSEIVWCQLPELVECARRFVGSLRIRGRGRSSSAEVMT